MIRTPRTVPPVIVVFLVLLSGCAGSTPSPGGPSSTGASSTTGSSIGSSTTGPAATVPAGSGANRTVLVTDNTWTDATDPAAIPLGDGKIVTTPAVGHLDSCQTTFGSGAGAAASGSWLDASAGTWNSETKPFVEGSVTWTNPVYSVTSDGTSRVITTSDLPTGEPTGIFPISPSDPVHRYDQNPNTIVRQNLTYEIPLHPAPAATASCTSLGAIGVLDDGVILLNALDAEGRDAAAHEILDRCDGHPMMAGMYHYHVVSPCIMPTTPGSSTLVGYALDGYGIYVERNAAGKLPTDADLDACHGRTSDVLFNGAMVSIYHYDATLEYPYTVGCYHGTPARVAPMP